MVYLYSHMFWLGRNKNLQSILQNPDLLIACPRLSATIQNTLRVFLHDLPQLLRTSNCGLDSRFQQSHIENVTTALRELR
jgi:hypothetical protein